ncbi:four helix bundle protein [Parapusillimonas sp. SGNA-6]|uniref:four helix bundle protein n=1 Tax=Parapedobacter sp. SGR-10 TaxID=2710879 RepID=UPI0013D317FD|nr:four helix bundle protein [Parapedobacter sp. SGR-10]NGF56554.1 four helix bundle protein [Parapedobacter sp. SGR-10]NGM89235.1 four helix bundle protein [Parapusillimonas sp. SGNA-6]
MHEFYFEKLSVWQNARTLVKDMYIDTADFPSQEQFGVTSQLRRATTSIAANIAEGMSRAGNKDKLRFLNQAYSSAIEVINFLILSVDLDFLTVENYTKLRNQVEYITNQLQALSKKIRS